MRYKIAICDDDIKQVGELEKIILKQLSKKKISADINTFITAYECYESIVSGDYYEIIFIDIEMGEISGIDIARFLRDKKQNTNTALIYVSSHEEYHMDIYQTIPSGFIKKPVNEIQVARLFELAMQRLDYNNNKRNQFICSSEGNKYLFSYRDILFFESLGRKMKLSTFKYDITFYSTIQNVYEQLDTDLFMIVHRSYIANMSNVTKIYNRRLYYDKKSIPVSDKYFKNILDFMNNHWG